MTTVPPTNRGPSVVATVAIFAALAGLIVLIETSTYASLNELCAEAAMTYSRASRECEAP